MNFKRKTKFYKQEQRRKRGSRSCIENKKGKFRLKRGKTKRGKHIRKESGSLCTKTDRMKSTS
jgi:hypothetical protein